ncbi:MAG: hypothetical protein HXS48_20755 [Theionarchaea archaeon]|nr:MAG: hypothetical protein AYK19_09765 [Theionarchaea archaeon DG-70-1]MBU7029378.1 hypothetical protein [Theionarchaea archaeon]
MSEELQKSERDELLERLGIYLPKDEEFKELLEREGIGYLIRKDVQESFTPAEIEKINRDVDEILAELAASPSGLSGNERVVSEVLCREAEKLKTFTLQGITFDVGEKGYAWKGTITLSVSSSDWPKATKQAELIAQLALIKLARTRGLVPKIAIVFEKEKSAPKKSKLTLQEAVQEIENFARKSLGDDYIMVKKRLQKHFSTKEDLIDASSEVQRILTLFIDEDIAQKFGNKVADIVYRIEGD